MQTDKDQEPVGENRGQLKLDHIEVRQFYRAQNPSAYHSYYDAFIRFLSNTSDAIDDSYSIFSSFASHGLALSQNLFMGLGSLLMLNYFYMSRRQHNALEADFEATVRQIDQTAIPSSTYQMLQNRLNEIGEVQLARDIETIIKTSCAQELLKKTERALELARTQFDGFLEENEPAQTKHPQLRAQLNEIRFIYAQLGLHSSLSAQKIKKNPELSQRLAKQDDAPKPPTMNRAQRLTDTAKKAWFWWLDHYKDVFSGITLTGTYASILISLIGISIINLFPWNLLFASALITLTAGGYFFTKHYFAQEILHYRQPKKTLKYRLNNKRVIAELWIKTKELSYQLTQTIQAFRLQAFHQHAGSHPDNSTSIDALIRSQEQLHEALKKLNHALVNEQNLSHREIDELRNQSKWLRYLLTYTLPTLFAVSSGYSIGATLLQLTIFAGIRVSMLPFIVIGLVCVVGYTSHALYQTYALFRGENTLLDKLNHNAIHPEHLTLLNNRLKRINQYGLVIDDTLYSLESYLKTHRGEDIVNHIIQFTPRNRRQTDLEQQLSERINLIKSKSIQSRLREHVQGIRVSPEIAEKKMALSREQWFWEQLQSLRQYLTINLKTILAGTTFGLSSSASLMLIFGAATLFSLQLTLAFLITSALVGATIALLNKHIKCFERDYRKHYKTVKMALHDKSELANMLILTLEARHQEAETKTTESALTQDLLQKAEVLSNNSEDDEVDMKELVAFHQVIGQLAHRLPLTLTPERRRVGMGVDLGVGQEDRDMQKGVLGH